jgi:hypothetical protein
MAAPWYRAAPARFVGRLLGPRRLGLLRAGLVAALVVAATFAGTPTAFADRTAQGEGADGSYSVAITLAGGRYEVSIIARNNSSDVTASTVDMEVVDDRGTRAFRNPYTGSRIQDTLAFDNRGPCTVRITFRFTRSGGQVQSNTTRPVTVSYPSGPSAATSAPPPAIAAPPPATAPAPDTTAPDTTAPRTTAPDTTAPETRSPDTGSPGTTAPDTTSPDGSAPTPDPRQADTSGSAADAADCVTPAGMNGLIDQDTSDSQRPWKRPAGSRVTINFVMDKSITPEWRADLEHGAEAWSKSPCLDTRIVDSCPSGGNCVDVSALDSMDADGNFDAVEKDGFTTGGKITLLNKLNKNQRRNVAVHEMGHAVGLVHRKTAHVMMNEDTFDDIFDPDQTDYKNLLFSYDRMQRKP